jgi:quinol monooxygenase YgiN
MYVVRNEMEVTLGRSSEFESTGSDLAAVFGSQPGFVGLTVLQSYGNPTRYTTVGRWADRAIAASSVRSEPFSRYARSVLTSGVFRPLRPPEAYEGVFEIDVDNVNAADSTCEVLVDWTIKRAPLAPAFEDFCRQMAQLSKQHVRGFVSYRLRRFLGNDVRYLVLAIMTDRAAARERLAVPEIQEFIESHPYTDLATNPPSVEVYSVVKRYAGTTPAAGVAAGEAAPAAVR